MTDFTGFICYTLKVTMKKLEKHLARELDKYGVNFGQSLILFSLLEKDGITLSEIGSRARIENSSLTTMVDRLEKELLVERRPDSQDRRIIRVFLTDRGRGLAREVLDAGERFNQYLEDRLGQNGNNLVKGLNTIADSID
ncbi:transcriptional regulator [Desulfocucumis palustris]|uniref:Transcriptional regulator n=1 Tax=Desulfocucumis palustris TaxID=1898651 RepID=A0A2L2X834_9FIRM|nr:MarR family transcriptional regulator [Desulfocucumis palustris]GBF32349.1 transcriptional regulator [Desulfocucumis palustris]